MGQIIFTKKQLQIWLIINYLLVLFAKGLLYTETHYKVEHHRVCGLHLYNVRS
jgi:hypothetical protein